MEWHKSEHPQDWLGLVLLCESGKILFNGQYDGDEFVVWDDENGLWRPPKNEIVVGWILQKEVEEYLEEHIHFLP